jgi:undecaprenyl pyrophosphate synthase
MEFVINLICDDCGELISEHTHIGDIEICPIDSLEFFSTQLTSECSNRVMDHNNKKDMEIEV